MSPDIRSQLQRTLRGAYTLELELGGGGMSRVFVAEESALRRKVVVKVLPPELIGDVNVDRFNREILLAAKLQHPHIVPVLTAGETEGIPYYTMPFVEGESLRAQLTKHGTLPITEAVGILRDVAKAIAYAHDRGVVHRDIKPDNVLISGGSAMVTDFGIAKAISASRTEPPNSRLTQAGTSIGTPTYMSPEQAAGDPDADYRTDIYSFGCMAYELVAGHPPFAEASPRKLLAAHMSEIPARLSTIRPDTPMQLAELVSRCLEKDPDARPAHASELVKALETVTSGTIETARPVLLGDAGMFRRALLVYAAAFVGVAVLARIAITEIGLPDWVFPGSLVVMGLVLPVLLWTGYTHHAARRAVMATPTFTPGGSRSVATGRMDSIAIEASRHMSWSRTARGGAIAMGAFVVVTAAFMVLRALGIGPAGSLLAAGTLKAKEPILLTDFTATNGDSALGRVVSDAVRAGLNESSVITLVSPVEIADALRRMQRAPTSRIDASLARQMAQREGIKAIVDGEVTQVGVGYVVAVRLITADSANELASYRAAASDAPGLIQASDELARKLRSKAGESLRRIQRTPPLARVTTASFEALRKFGDGSRANDAQDYATAVRALREAVVLDSTFGTAWRKLAAAMGNLGLPQVVVDSAIRRAYALRDRMTENERDLVTGDYYRSGPGRDRAKAIEAYESLLSRGDSTTGLNNLAIAYLSRREFARAESLEVAALRLFPNDRNRAVLFNIYVMEGQFAKSDSFLNARLQNSPGLRSRAVGGLFRRGELDAFDKAIDAERKVARNRSDPSWPDQYAGLLAVARGRLRASRVFYAQMRAIDSALGRAPPLAAEVANRLLDAGAAGIASDAQTRSLDSALARGPLNRLAPVDRPDLTVAQAYALAGRADRARAIVAQYQREISDTALKRSQLPAFHQTMAEIAAAEKRWGDAVDELRRSDSLPDGPANSCTYCLQISLFTMFARAGMVDSALAQYDLYKRSPWGRRELHGPDMVLGAVGYERLAELYEKKGDISNASKNYEMFIDLWKNADPELQPRVTEARRRRAMLTLPSKTPLGVR